MFRFPLLLCICLVLACSAPAHSRQLTDESGRTVTVPADIRRVVSLAPSLTEIVYQLGRGKLLKGATQFSYIPAEAKLLPRVGSYVRIDVEKVVALEPDLCLATKDGNPQHIVSRLESLGIPVYVVDPHSIEDIMQTMLGLGDLLGAEHRAAAIVADMRRRVDAITGKLAGVETKPGVFFQIDAAPIVSASSGTFINELIVKAGGRNLVADAAIRYPKLSWEDILQYSPDVVLIATMAGGHSIESLKSGWYRWPQLPAVKNGRIHVVDADLVDRPTSRLIDGLEVFARLIHPELFGEQ